MNRYIDTNGVRLHVIEEGPAEGPLVIMLHGFPEFSYSWQKQIKAFADSGYHVIAPDQRGYNLSDKPEGLEAYSLDELATDVIGLIDAAGVQKAFIIGHDWGASVAWWVAGKHPERIKKLAIMNVPHGAVMQKHIKSSFTQMCKSWYMFFFQIPWLPEAMARLRNWNMPIQTLLTSSRPGTFTKDDLVQYRQAWSQPKAYTSMLNWYRAIIQKPSTPPASSRITVPTLMIWGSQDQFLGREMAQPSIDLCDTGQLIFIENATHWIHHEEPKQVNHLILGFFNPQNT